MILLLAFLKIILSASSTTSNKYQNKEEHIEIQVHSKVISSQQTRNQANIIRGSPTSGGTGRGKVEEFR